MLSFKPVDFIAPGSRSHELGQMLSTKSWCKDLMLLLL
jgi:hypothetical protein